MHPLYRCLRALFGYSSTGPATGRRRIRPQLESLEDRVVPSAPTLDNVRYASSTNRIYVTGEVTATLSDIETLLPKAPLDLVDPVNHVWLLRANLYLQQGARLDLHGSSVGGDVDQLRLLSNNSSAANSFVEINADWGIIDVDSTHITSWDQAVNGPDTEVNTYKRSFIRARSSLDADGVTAHESTMNIRDSDIGFLGYENSETYGLSWKVVGSPGTNFSLYDKVDVFGNVENSHIHNNFFGVYTFGGYGMQFVDNEVNDNLGYGLDYHDDSDYFLVQGNDVHDNGNIDTAAGHGIIFSKRCDHAQILDNISENNFSNGIMMHRTSDDAIIDGNTVVDNGDGGIAIYDSYRTVVSNNDVEGNKSGIRLSVGSANNTVTGNTVAGNTYGIYLYQGSDQATFPENRPHDNLIVGNSVSGSLSNGVKFTQALNNTIRGNQITGGGTTVYVDRGFGNLFDGNTFLSTALVKSKGTSSEPAQTKFINTPSVKVQVDAFSSMIFTDGGGAVFQVAKPNIGTTVSTTGSSLTLTSALIGTSSVQVTTLSFDVTAQANAVLTPVSWSTSATGTKQWTTTSSAATQTLTYAVGNLTPGTSYTVRKNGVVLLTLIADASGTITFQDIPGTTSAVTFIVKPA